MPRISALLGLLILGMLGVSALLIGQAHAQDNQQIAPLLEGLGDYHVPITTDVPRAQRFFDQGMVLAYGFNHAEAERSFREAARLDPACAMCYWGVALVLGPNINAAMEDENVPKAYEALQQALALADRANDQERAFIEALTKRYTPEPVEDRTSLDVAYAEAMRGVARRYADDPGAVTLLAEALMDLHPWDFWTKEGAAQPWTPEILATLEAAMKLAPHHPGANHLYIHAVEASPHPQRAEPHADRLGGIAPGAGHLVHMPAHIYLRIGRYHAASTANEKAIVADQDYVTQCHAQGLYPIAYMPHNRHFLWATATLEGRSAVAIGAAREMAEHIDAEMMRAPGMGTLQHYWITPLYALVRFGQWDEILNEPAPAEDLVYPTGVWHYARGMAFTRKGQLEKAAQELDHLTTIAANPVLESVTIWDINTTAHLMRIATAALAGELAAAQGDQAGAIERLKEAVRLEDALNYDEPPPWHYPVRQSLGAVLLEAGKAAEAEQVYREDLRRHPKNGWSLFGLARSLHAQGNTDEARQIEAHFEKAWTHADVTLHHSRF